MKKIMSDKHKLIAYTLSTDEDLNAHKNISQKDIANILGVSQPSVSQAIKEVKLRMQIHNLECQLSEAKQAISSDTEYQSLGFPPVKSTKYKRKP